MSTELDDSGQEKGGLRPWPEPPAYIDTAEIRRELEGWGQVDAIERPLILALCDEIDRLRGDAPPSRNLGEEFLAQEPLEAEHG